jgi:Tfp pilus assembly protein PilX
MKHRRSERGVALIICLFALMLLSGIGLGMMYMADTETSINRNYRDAQQAYFAAAAGIQEVRERLMPTSLTVLTAAQTPSTLPNNGVSTGVTYVLNYTSSIPASAITPWDMSDTSLYRDTEFCHENFSNAGAPLVANPGPNTPCTQQNQVPTGTYYTTVDSNLPLSGTYPLLGTDANLAYRWVRVTLKSNKTAVPFDPTLGASYSVYAGSANDVPICWDGTAELPKPAGYATCDVDPPPDGVTYLKSVYMLTALAVTQNGSRRMTQMEVANNPPLLTNAALDTDDFVSVSGSSVTVNGYDNCKCSCDTGDGSHPPNCTNRVGGGACTGSTYAIYSSQAVTTSGNPALVSGVTTNAPGDTCPNPSVACNQPFPYDVPSLINKYSSMPGAVNTTGAPYNISCTSGTPYQNCGTLSAGSLGTAPTGFPVFDPNNPVGVVYQTTYVPGSFDIQAHTSGAGVLIVDGDLTIHGGLNFYGLIIVRGVLTFSGSGTGQSSNVIGAVIAGNGSVADSLSGGINVQYDRCALLHNQTPQPPALLATHEVSY